MGVVLVPNVQGWTQNIMLCSKATQSCCKTHDYMKTQIVSLFSFLLGCPFRIALTIPKKDKRILSFKVSRFMSSCDKGLLNGVYFFKEL